MVGSAWMPWVRPMVGVCLNSRARCLRMRGERQNALANEPGGLFDLQRLGGVDHVVGSETVVQPTGFRADLFRHGGGEGDDVVLDLGLDLLNAGDVDISVGANGPRGRVGHDAGLGQDLGGGGFDLQPHAVLVFFTPDPAHGRAGVTSDQPKPPQPTYYSIVAASHWFGRIDLWKKNRN